MTRVILAFFSLFIGLFGMALLLLVGLCFVASAADINYTSLNPNAKTYLPILLEQHQQYWPEMESPSVFAAQVDVETCITQKHKFCWSPYAELKTSREQGTGLGQITRAWDSTGRLRFDSLEDIRSRHKEALSEWSWRNVSVALFQLRALVLMDFDNYKVFSNAKTEMDRFAFMDAAYNGGLSGVLSEIKLCENTPGCDPGIWFGHVELTSKKARTATSGYGKGFYYINREHVKNVLFDRRQRYTEAGLP